MADIRSMLAAERQSRRIEHPNATYTANGRLICSLCETMIKSEAAWQPHIRNSRHTLLATRADTSSAASRGAEDAADTHRAEASETGGKKRKAVDFGSPRTDEHKRARALQHDRETEERMERQDPDEAVKLEGLGAMTRGNFRPEQVPVEMEKADDEQSPTEVPETKIEHAGRRQDSKREDVDQAEMAAFEKELADLEASSAAESHALNARATISAAPMTAEDVAAQAREEQSTQRGRRDAEIEAEREDAANTLQEEFEEMHELEERVKKLREKREALRKPGSNGNGDANGGAETRDLAGEIEFNRSAPVAEEEDDNDDEEDDAWTFGGS